MPELPEVETVRRGLERCLVGRRLRHAHVLGRLRTPLDEGELEAFCAGHEIASVRRRAKYLLVAFADGGGLLLHLGMTGSFKVDGGRPEEERHCRVWWELDNGLTWRFLDIRRFGQLRLCPGDWSGVGGVPECLAGLGDEPLEDGFDGARLLAIGKGRRQAVKQVIMDQRLLVGVGNIYASESLFRAGIDPRRPFATLRRREADRLATAIREVLLESIEAGGTTISDFVTLDGSEGGYTVHLRVYGRQGEPCVRCGATLERMVQGGRSTFFCPHCQK